MDTLQKLGYIEYMSCVFLSYSTRYQIRLCLPNAWQCWYLLSSCFFSIHLSLVFILILVSLIFCLAFVDGLFKWYHNLEGFKACLQTLVRAERDSFLEKRKRRRKVERDILVPWVLSKVDSIISIILNNWIWFSNCYLRSTSRKDKRLFQQGHSPADGTTQSDD